MVFFVAINVLLLGFVHVAVGTPCPPKVCGDDIPKVCGDGIPKVCGDGGGISGITSGVSKSFSESEKSMTSASSSSYESSSSSFSSMGSSCSSFDSSYWSSIFDKCSGISQIERDCYLKWLQTFSSSSLEYYSSIADYLTIKEALSSDILDFALLQQDISAAYSYFSSEYGLYSSTDIDIMSQSTIFEEYAKSKLSKTLTCLSPGSPLYNLLKYSIESDYVSLPCTLGFLNSIIQSQQTYFSSSSTSSSVRSVESSSTSTTSTTAVSSVDVSQYQSILQAASIQEAEYSTYLNYLSKLSSDKICLFTDLINFLNKDSQVLTTEMILDFTNLNQELHSLYELMTKEQFFCANADWLAKEAVLSEMKSKLSGIFGYISKDCCMYTALQYCLDQDICYLPLFIGLSNYLLEQQSSYFSISTSSSTTVSSSSSSSSSCSKVCR